MSDLSVNLRRVRWPGAKCTRGRDVIDTARAAGAASTIAVTSHGSQKSYPSPADLAQVLERVQVVAAPGS